MQRLVRPDRAQDTERHAHDEDRVPVDRGQYATDDQSEEGAGDGRDLIHADRESTSVRRERVREDRGRVREQHRAADGLHHAPSDQPERSGTAGERVEHQGDRGDGEDHEAEVVDAHAAVDVTEAPETDHEHGGDQNVAHQHPEQVADVAGLERVELDAGEDRGQRDQHNGAVDRRHQDAQGGVAQGDPLVVRVVLVEHSSAFARGLRV